MSSAERVFVLLLSCRLDLYALTVRKTCLLCVCFVFLVVATRADGYKDGERRVSWDGKKEKEKKRWDWNWGGGKRKGGLMHPSFG